MNDKSNLRKSGLYKKQEKQFLISVVGYLVVIGILSLLVSLLCVFIFLGLTEDGEDDSAVYNQHTTYNITISNHNTFTSTPQEVLESIEEENKEDEVTEESTKKTETKKKTKKKMKSNTTKVKDSLGDSKIKVDGVTLIRYCLPNAYYNNLDYSSFQPYMDYRKVTDTFSAAYKISHASNTYVDKYGMLRYQLDEKQFSIDNKDDYVVALGTYYHKKGKCGDRYLIITSNGMYTCITGDEKADCDTDPYHMYSYHESYAGLIEWLVNSDSLHSSIKRSGSITSSPEEVLQGEILYIYKIK